MNNNFRKINLYILSLGLLFVFLIIITIKFPNECFDIKDFGDWKDILLGEDGTVETENGYPVLQYVYGKFWVNNHAHILKGKNGFDENSLFVLLNNTNISDIITGGVQAKISQTNLKTVKISIPPQDLIQALNKKLKPIFNLKIQTLEIQKICFKLKEILLSKMATIEG